MIETNIATHIPTLLALQSGMTYAPGTLTAREALKHAAEARYVLPSDLSALYAKFVITDHEGDLSGSIAWTKAEGLEVSVAGTGERAEDYQRRVESLIQHRLPSDFEQGDGKHNLTWTGKDNLIGKQIALNDAMNSMYRVNGGSIVEVDRTLGDTRLIVSVVDVEKLTNGKNLPKAMVVSYFDAASGALKRTETIVDTYKDRNGVLVPSSRRVYVSERGTVRAFEITLSDLRLDRK
ncbi:MAG: hypothetical protein C4341_07170 [Armatimonadota bacterium]